MKKKHGTFRIWCEYGIARLLAGVLTVLPLFLAVRVGRMLTWTLSRCDVRHRRYAEAAIATHLPCSKAEATVIARKMYQHLGTMVAEFPRHRTITEENIDTLVDWGDIASLIEPVRAEGKGIIFVTGHFGNWEATGHAYSIKKYIRGSVARPLDNPLLDTWITRMRESRGQTIWAKQGAMRSAMRTLRQGGAFGILVDQNGGDGGADSTFFGERCSSMPAPADLALRTDAVIIPAGLVRTSPMHFRAVWRDPIRVRPDQPYDEERTRLVQACNDALESIIREAPEQWLWMHRRWRPKKEWNSESKNGQ